MTEVNPWHSFRIRKAAAEDPAQIGSYGGHPRGIRGHQWPRCKVCGAPMCHMMQLDAGPHLNLGPFARMTVFICHATGGRCEDWDAWKGSNRVLLQRAKDDNLYDGPPTVRVYRRIRLKIDKPIDEREVMGRVRREGIPVKEALEQLRHDKFGGGAVWLHGDDTPQSQAGQGPMRLLLQFTTEVVKFDITPGGMGYIFIDPYDPSEHAARFLWQGG